MLAFINTYILIRISVIIVLNLLFLLTFLLGVLLVDFWSLAKPFITISTVRNGVFFTISLAPVTFDSKAVIVIPTSYAYSIPNLMRNMFATLSQYRIFIIFLCLAVFIVTFGFETLIIFH